MGKDDPTVATEMALNDLAWRLDAITRELLQLRRRLESPLLAGRDSCREASALLTEAHAKAASALARID